MSHEELDRLEQLANAATPGPWAVHDQGRDDYSVCKEQGNGRCQPLFERTAPYDECADGHFIAAARTAVPELVAEVRRWQAAARAAWAYIDQNPGDPDIYPEQYEAWLAHVAARKALEAP